MYDLGLRATQLVKPEKGSGIRQKSRVPRWLGLLSESTSIKRLRLSSDVFCFSVDGIDGCGREFCDAADRLFYGFVGDAPEAMRMAVRISKLFGKPRQHGIDHSRVTLRRRMVV